MTDKDVRQAILEVMNAHRKSARSERELQMQLRQIQVALEDEYDIEDEKVVQAVGYLTDAGLLKHRQETKTVKPISTRLRTSSRFSSSSASTKHVKHYYRLTNRAIDKLEGETEYSKSAFVPFQNIHITTTNAPVVVGSNNVVKNNVTLFAQLDDLRQAISENEELSVESRQDAAGDIESLKQQLAKPNPSKDVISSLWKNIGRTADLAGVAGLALEIAKGISALTGNSTG